MYLSWRKSLAFGLEDKVLALVLVLLLESWVLVLVSTTRPWYKGLVDITGLRRGEAYLEADCLSRRNSQCENALGSMRVCDNNVTL